MKQWNNRRRNLSGMLALLLALTFTVQSTAVPVYASDSPDTEQTALEDPVVQTESEEEADGTDNPSGPDDAVGGGSTGETGPDHTNGEGGGTDDTGTGEAGTDGSGTDGTVTDGDSADGNGSDGTGTDGAGEETQSDDAVTGADAETDGDPQEENETSDADASDGEEKDKETGDLPEGIAGMPEGYELTAEERAVKQSVRSHKVTDDLRSMMAGVDYAAEHVICAADSHEHAEMIARAYNGTLLEFSYGIATILLDTDSLTVEEAVAIGADENLPIPAVEPDYIISVEEPAEDGEERVTAAKNFASVPVSQTWQSGYDSIFNDPALINPTSSNYQWMHSMINSYAAWGVTLGKRSATVAVIDSGVYTDHEELRGHATAVDIGLKVVEWKDGREQESSALIGTAPIGGHGTHVAGIIAASVNNGKGGAGVAPGAQILSIRTGQTERGGHYAGNVSRAIRYVAGIDYNGTDTGFRRADIINLSIGQSAYNDTYQKAVTKAYERGVTVCAAMSNDSANARMYPAAFEHVIAVCAVNENGDLAGFSNYGSWADIAAPGVHIYSTIENGSYDIYDGTSMACPVVAGACALYMSAYGHVAPDTMEQVLKRSVNKSASKQIGAGIIDVSKMFSSDTTPPAIALSSTSGESISVAKSGATVTVNAAIGTDTEIIVTPQSFNGAGAQNGVMIYTTNGKEPAILNGETKNGELYTGPVRISELTGPLTTKKVITFKAACVSGMGVLSKSTTMKITVDPSIPSSVKISGNPNKLVAGKAVTLTANITPDAASKKVIWEIVKEKTDGSLTGAAVNAGGKITTKAGQSGILVIRATSNVDPSKRDEVTIHITDEKPVGTLLLDQKAAAGSVSKNRTPATTISIAVETLKDTDGKDKTGADASLVWSSSNTKIATVTPEAGSDGMRAIVTPVARGTASITVRALDGSGKSATCKVTVSQLTESLTVNGQAAIAPGTSAAYKAVAAPSTANVKTVTWSVTDMSGNLKEIDGVTVDAKRGTVKVAKEVPTGTEFYVCATATDSGEVKAVVPVAVKAKTTWVRISEGSEVLASKTSFVNKTFTLRAQTENGIAPLWSSSNQKVAKVDASGDTVTVTTVAKGTANITAAAQDGSGKKAVLKLTVWEPVSRIEVTGQKYISQGASATYKASVLEKTASVKSVTWSVIPSVDEVTVSKSGAVKVTKEAATGTYTVMASATDNSGVSGSMSFEVTKARVNTVRISAPSAGTHHMPKYDKKGNLTQVQLFTVNAGRDAVDETKIVLDAALLFADETASSSIPVWSSSKEAVVTIEGAREAKTVTVRALSKGSAKITCAAQDGSGKKATITINAIVPVSDLSLTPKNGQEKFIGFGKSATLVPVAGSLYGKPNNAKVAWDYELVAYDSNTKTYQRNTAYNDVFKAKKLVSVSNGKVSVAAEKNFDKYLSEQWCWDAWTMNREGVYGYGIRVTATATDGSGCKSEWVYWIVTPPTYINLWWDHYYYANGKRWRLYADSSYVLECETNGIAFDFAVTSSNPEVVSAWIDYRAEPFVVNGVRYDGYYALCLRTGKKKGSATVTISSRDGSGKKASLSFVVQ